MEPRVRIVVFTRWPEPGVCKTRLIASLGPQGAADLHRRLTERTIAAVRATACDCEVRTTGAPEPHFAAWLGEDLAYVDQGGGDLGERLARAAERPPVLLIGADAPDLTAAHLRAAAEALAHAPAVIGPAEDGGYWLLGLREAAPFAFVDMPWSTDAVCALTVGRLAEHGLEPHRLETLADLDRPEDLARWPELVA